MNGEHKITSGHLERTAAVYLRQSTLMQVREHTESTLRQYALADTAVALGWAPKDVQVIDRDLGLSGTSAAHRQGFRELMSRVCLGEIGAVFGLEVSRLGRSNADLARLAEMARLTDTLLIDSDGVYDLADFNDWLVLGLKSTLSLADLHILAGRLQAASGPPPNAASCVPRCRSGWSTTTTAWPCSTPMPRSRPLSLTSSPASLRPGRLMASWRRSPAASSPSGLTAACGPGSCAGRR